MFELVSVNRKVLEKRLRDDTGAASSEWIVAAAIVILFSIPVLTLLSSGSTSTSQRVVEALEAPNSVTLAANAYTPEGDGDDENNGAALSSVEQNAAPSIPGLDKGVGFEISAAESKRGYQADTLGASRSLNRSSASAASGGFNQINTPNTPSIGGTRTRRTGQPRAVYVGPRRDKPEVRQTRVARMAEQKNRAVNDKTIQRKGTVTKNGPAHNGAPAENTETVDIATCETHTRPKFIERRHEFEVGAGLDEELFTDGGSIVENKRREIFSDDEISFVGDETETVTVDCAENRALVTAAGEQLGDGTILGMVTISASADEAPTRRAAPLGLGSRLSNAIGRQEIEVDDSALDDRTASGPNEAGILFEAFASVEPTFAEIAPVFEISFDFESNSLAGFRAEASFAGEVEFIPVKSTVINRSGR